MPNRNFDNINLFPTLLTQTVDDTIELVAIDTVPFVGNGINIHAASPSYTDGTFEFAILHSDSLTTGYTAVPEEAIIGDTTSYPYLDDLKITAVAPEGKCLPYVQLKYSKRYITLRIKSTGTDSGALLLMAYNLSRGEEPVDRAGELLNYYYFI